MIERVFFTSSQCDICSIHLRKIDEREKRQKYLELSCILEQTEFSLLCLAPCSMSLILPVHIVFMIMQDLKASVDMRDPFGLYK